MFTGGEALALWLGATGGSIVILGSVFPKLNAWFRWLLHHPWFLSRSNSWSSIPVTSVKWFVRASEWLSNLMAASANHILVGPIVLIAAIWGASNLTDNAAKGGGFLSGLMPETLFGVHIPVPSMGTMILASIVALVAGIVVKLHQSAVSNVVEIRRLGRRRFRLSASKDAYSTEHDELERVIKKEKSDENVDEGFIRFLQRRVESVNSRIKFVDNVLNETINKIDHKASPDTANRAISGMFRIFIVSSIAVLIYSSVFYNIIAPQLTTALFESGPAFGLQAIVYTMLPIMVVFLFLQFLIPSTMVLNNPDELFVSKDPEEKVEDPLGQSTYFLFLLGLSISLLLTYSAFAIGHLLYPDEYIPQTFRMVWVNTIFDGITFAVTLYLMKWVGRITGGFAFLAITILILADWFLAGLLGMGSLYLGLLGTEHAITLREGLNILLSFDATGHTRTLGPMFWVMHTSFIPTTIYLGAMLFLFFSKLIISIFTRVLGAANSDLPATGAMMAALGAIVQLTIFYFPNLA